MTARAVGLEYRLDLVRKSAVGLAECRSRSKSQQRQDSKDAAPVQTCDAAVLLEIFYKPNWSYSLLELSLNIQLG